MTATASRSSDARGEAVDAYAMHHLHPSSATPSPGALTAALANSAAHSLPNIAVSPAQGKLLMLQARMLGAAHVLEVGTLGGYSAIWLASANSRVRVVSVEIDAKHAEVARENLGNAGVADRVEVLVGAGLDVLPSMLEGFHRGERKPFDMVFIDADKANGAAYFDLAVQMCRPGACVIVDNVVRQGKLADEEIAKTDVNVAGSRKTVEKAGADSRVDAVVTQIVGEKGYDGFLVAVVGEP